MQLQRSTHDRCHAFSNIGGVFDLRNSTILDELVGLKSVDIELGHTHKQS